MAKKSISQKVVAYMLANPSAKAADVAAKFETSVPYVYILRSKMKKDSVLAPSGTQPKEANIDAVHTAPAVDMVNHPPHYTVGGIETIDFIEAKGLGYNLGNAVKYITRADHKGTKVADLQKAMWYLKREIERLS